MSEMRRPPRRPGGPMGHGPGGIPGEKAKDFKGTMGKLLRYISSYTVPIILVALFAVGSTVFSIIGPKKLGNATTEIFNGLVAKISGVEGGGIDFEKAWEYPAVSAVSLYPECSAFVFAGIIMTGITQRISYRLRKEISQKINRLPMKYFDGMTHGEVLSRVTNDVDTVSQSLNQSMTQIVTSVTTMIGVLIMMLSISPLMTLAALVILPISLLCISFIVKHSQKYFKAQQEYLGHVNGQVEEVFGGHNVVKVFNNEKKRD